MNKEKAKKEAKDWIISTINFCCFDCYDSMQYAEQSENRFNAFVEDSISIEDFIKNDQELMEFYFQTLKNEEYKDLDLNDLPSQLPFKADR